jgi:hypothetical protein
MVTAFGAVVERTAHELVRTVPVERWGQGGILRKAPSAPGQRL